MAKKAPRPHGIEKARALKLTVTNVAVLKELEKSPRQQYEIAAALDISKQTLAYNMKKLGAAGFVAAGEGRKHSLTVEGRKAVQDIS